MGGSPEPETGDASVSGASLLPGQRKGIYGSRDSGNRLREPVTGKPVSVISYEDCRGFCDTLSAVFCIPYRSVGKEQGMLTGIVFERMEIFRDSGVLTVEKPVVAVAREPLSADGALPCCCRRNWSYEEERFMIIKISIPNRIKLKKVASLRAVFWPKEGEIHYIGGADVLPAPLSAAEETETLARFGTEGEKEAKSR